MQTSCQKLSLLKTLPLKISNLIGCPLYKELRNQRTAWKGENICQHWILTNSRTGWLQLLPRSLWEPNYPNRGLHLPATNLCNSQVIDTGRIALLKEISPLETSLREVELDALMRTDLMICTIWTCEHSAWKTTQNVVKSDVTGQMDHLVMMSIVNKMRTGGCKEVRGRGFLKSKPILTG